MSSAARDVIEMQAAEHPLEYVDRFRSLEAYCTYLMHRRAYEEAARLARSRTVLDLGSNNGYGTHFLSGVAESVIGIDVSESAVADARRRFPTCDFRLYDGMTLPFADARFDLVVSLQVIEHVVDTRNYLSEISRVLKPEGTAIFTTPNAAIRLDPGMRPWNRFHVREYRADELRETLTGLFDRVSVRGLFADEALQQVEYRRCQKALESARRALAAPSGRDVGWKPRLVGLAKSALPAPAIAALGALRHRWLGGARHAEIGPEELARYSTANFFYRDADLDRALDLMAIGRKAATA